jgi:hypothetical protein
VIGSAGTGADFRGLQGYLLHGRGEDGEVRVGWTSVRNLGWEDPEIAATQMDATASQNARVQKPVYHLSLNAPPGEHLSREEWEQVAVRVLKDLGLEEHQALIVAHTDRPHEHVHLMVNRVHPEHLKTWSNSHDYARIERSLRQIERDMNLREVPGNHHRLPGQEAPQRDQGLTSGETREQRRTGDQPWTAQVRFTVYNDFRDAESWGDLEARLGQHGLELRKRGRGLVVTDGERQLKISRIHRGRSTAKLEKRFGISFDEWRDRVGELRESVETFQTTEANRKALHLEHAGLREKVEQAQAGLKPFGDLAREQREVKVRLEAQLWTIYGRDREPEFLRAAIDLARSSSYERAAEALRRDPKILGTLAGKGLGPTADVVRREALFTVPKAAGSLERLGELRRQVAQLLDREMKAFWEKEGRPTEAPDSRTQVRWHVEDAARAIDRLLPRVFRPEAVQQVAENVKYTRSPQRTADLLAQNPHTFGRVRGRGRGPFTNQERRTALATVPQLAAAVQEHGEQRRLWIRLLFKDRNREYQSASDRFNRVLQGLNRLPSRTQLLLDVAKAAERVGVATVGRVLPIPEEIRALKTGARGLRAAVRSTRGIASGAGPVSPKKSARRIATSGARLAGTVSARILHHVLPLPPQVKVVHLALKTAATLARSVSRELTR